MKYYRAAFVNVFGQITSPMQNVNLNWFYLIFLVKGSFGFCHQVFTLTYKNRQAVGEKWRTLRVKIPLKYLHITSIMTVKDKLTAFLKKPALCHKCKIITNCSCYLKIKRFQYNIHTNIAQIIINYQVLT